MIKVRSRRLKLFIIKFIFLSMERGLQYTFAFLAADEATNRSFFFYGLHCSEVPYVCYFLWRIHNGFPLWVSFGYCFFVQNEVLLLESLPRRHLSLQIVLIVL